MGILVVRKIGKADDLAALIEIRREGARAP
jgi:hypothetical protein